MAKPNEQTAINLTQQIEALLREYPDLADDEILLADMLEGQTDLANVLTSLIVALDDAKALRDGTAGRLEELTARKARFGRRMEFVRSLILRIMEAAQLPKVELPEATLSLRKNQQALIGEGDGDLPDELCKIKREPDRKKIKEAIQGGREVPGFTLNNAPPSLTVRVK
ncbi:MULTISPECIES: siphovirus Gp157 family protein [unclassified Bradyrhizobium]|uniref:siphovirus Gp157 family protein n=1 Tax=unclassified Bradyrhizobium TaxID=2631580 RepID=UPI002FF1911C